MTKAKPPRLEPGAVYRQVCRDPAIHTREEALRCLAGASPSELWQSVKLSVDERIKDLLAQQGFESLGREILDPLHAHLLGIRSSLWSRDLDQLARREEALRELWSGGKLASAVDSRADGDQLQTGLLRLVEQLQMTLAFERCTRGREEHGWGAAGWLDCLLNGAPGN